MYRYLPSSIRGVFRVLWLFFFFQAEDGIRDLTVTGVQTCALPISGRSSGGVAVNLPTQRLLRDEGAEGEELETYCGAKETDHYSSRCEGAAAFTEVRRKVGWMHEGVGPPNGSRLSCGPLKKDSFRNLRAPA